MRKQKLAVVTICVGPRYEAIAELTHPTLKAYADRIGAEFIVWRHFEGHKNPAWQKLELYNLLEEFDRVCFLDTDIIVRPDTPNVFETVPEDHMGLFNEFGVTNRIQTMMSWEPSAEWVKRGKYFNTGVMVMSSCHKEVFRPTFPERDSFYEQTHLNYMIYQLGIDVHEFSHRMNRMSCMDKIIGENRLSCYIVHYAGCTLDTMKFLELITMDLKDWEKTAPEYRYQKNIYIAANGGLGDIVAQEPAIRYIYEKHWKNENVVIQTQYPEIFRHLEGVKINKPGTLIADVGFFTVDTMPPDGHLSQETAIHALCHPTDHASLLLFKGTMEPQRKQIKLLTDGHKLDAETEEALKDCILIHAGKGWQSKTFPKEFWDEMILEILRGGGNVALIGKTISDTQGFVDVDASRCLDLRDKLDLVSLFRAIELAPLLITNDSSPLHIAGAFDNFIGLLASCKAPFRIVPFRKGLQGHKVTILSEGVIEKPFDPTHPFYVGLDICEPEDLKRITPDPIKVAHWALHKMLVDLRLG